MTNCIHDPAFTTDGRCSKCYPPRHYSVNPAVTMLTAAPLGAEKVAQFAAYTNGLSAADIAQMQAMCDETATEAPSHDGMWK
jgi:hypothetical protein